MIITINKEQTLVSDSKHESKYFDYKVIPGVPNETQRFELTIFMDKIDNKFLREEIQILNKNFKLTKNEKLIMSCDLGAEHTGTIFDIVEKGSTITIFGWLDKK